MRVSRPPASRGIAATLNRPMPNERMLAALASSPAKPMKVFSTSWKKRDPSTVGRRRPPLRSNSGNCVIASSCPIRRLIWGCEVCMRKAACVIDPVTKTARKASTCFRPIRLVAKSNPYRRVLNWNFIRSGFWTIVQSTELFARSCPGFAHPPWTASPAFATRGGHMKATMIKALAAATVAAVLLSSEAMAQGAGRLDKIRESGSITLGYPETSVPFAYLDGNQKPIGYTVEICEQVVQAIKTALKLPKLEVRYNPITSATRIQLLANGT